MIGTMGRKRKGGMVKRRWGKRRIGLVMFLNMVKIKTQNWVLGQC